MTEALKNTHSLADDASRVKLNGDLPQNPVTPHKNTSKMTDNTITPGSLFLPKGDRVVTFVSKKTQKEIGYKCLGCWYSAAYNQKNGYAPLNLDFKVGTLIVTKTAPSGEALYGGWGHMPIGGKQAAAPQNLAHWKELMDESKTDVHCWLEDKKGNVYDYDFLTATPLEGLDAKALKKKGLTYVAAKGACEAYLWKTCDLKVRVEGFHILAEQNKPWKTLMEEYDSYLSYKNYLGGIILEHKVKTLNLTHKPSEEVEAFIDKMWVEYNLNAEAKPKVTPVTDEV